jgi:hypothetical protein
MDSSKRVWKKKSAALIVLLVIASGCTDEAPAPAAAVTGSVVAEDGSSIAGVTVTCCSHETVTDDSGTFSFENLSPGGCRLSLHKEGFVEIVVFVEPRADTSIDTGEILMCEKHGDIVQIEELPEDYVPGVEAEVLIHYYCDIGFEKGDSARVVYATGAVNVTSLTTATQSAFVVESSGAAGIMIDFSQQIKEIRVGDIALTAPFGGEIGERVSVFVPQESETAESEEEPFNWIEKKGATGFDRGVNIWGGILHPLSFRAEEGSSLILLQGTVSCGSTAAGGMLWGDTRIDGAGLPNAEDEKEFNKIFIEKKKKKPAAGEFNDKVADIIEDLLHPDFLRKAYGLVTILASLPTNFQEFLTAATDLYQVALELGEALKEAAVEMKAYLEKEKLRVEGNILGDEHCIDTLNSMIEVDRTKKKECEEKLKELEKELAEELKIPEPYRSQEKLKRLEIEIRRLKEEISSYDWEIGNFEADAEVHKFDLEEHKRRLEEIKRSIKILDDFIKGRTQFLYTC